MKKLILFIAPLFLSALLFANSEEPAPSTSSSVSWHAVTVIDYKPGTVEAAKDLIQKFELASLTAGTPSPVIYWFDNGKYDMVITWELQDGKAESKGSWNPEDIQWKKALIAQEGSEAAANSLEIAYNDMIASSFTNVSRRAK